MDKKLYDTIFKRKSFHLFKGLGKEKLSQADLDNIIAAYKTFEVLYPNIQTDIKIAKSQKRNAEYDILIYSEKKDNYLMNAGYIGEQLDLYLQKNNIASLWYGLGKPNEKTYNDLDFVIMFCIRKASNQSKYRKDMYKAKRKDLRDTWQGDYLDIANEARFAPSAVNSQPWYVKNDGKTLTVYRYKKPGRIGIMNTKSARYFNRIDIGIYLCFLEICMAEKSIIFNRELFIDKGGEDEYTKVATYSLL